MAFSKPTLQQISDRIISDFESRLSTLWNKSVTLLRRSVLRVMGRMLRLYFSNPAYRKFVKGVGQEGVAPENLTEYFGYGVYVGRK